MKFHFVFCIADIRARENRLTDFTVSDQWKVLCASGVLLSIPGKEGQKKRKKFKKEFLSLSVECIRGGIGWGRWWTKEGRDGRFESGEKCRVRSPTLTTGRGCWCPPRALPLLLLDGARDRVETRRVLYQLRSRTASRRSRGCWCRRRRRRCCCCRRRRRDRAADTVPTLRGLKVSLNTEPIIIGESL